MKLIVQIPCYDEESSLGAVLRDIPEGIDGVDVIETLVLDDGSGDGTSSVARGAGADYIVRLKKNMGLARAFSAAIEHSLHFGADIIVNTDGDGQYRGADIPRLIRPLLDGKAEMVVGVRNFRQIPGYPRIKELLQRLGSVVVRSLSGTDVPDATSGFRAYTRDAAIHLHVTSGYTYTFDTLVQMGKKRFPIDYIPIRVNPPRRKSRLYRTIPGYVMRMGGTILRIYAIYEPLKVFSSLGLLFFGSGLAISLRFLYFYATQDYSGHVQSLILSAVLLLMGVLLFLLGLLGDLIATNRKFLEEIVAGSRRKEYGITYDTPSADRVVEVVGKSAEPGDSSGVDAGNMIDFAGKPRLVDAGDDESESGSNVPGG